MADPFFRKDLGGPPGRTKAQNRATVQQLKLIGQSHPTGLTPSLLKLFEPRPLPEHKPPLEKRKMPPLTGVAQFVDQFADADDKGNVAPPVKVETRRRRSSASAMLGWPRDRTRWPKR